MNYDGYGEFGWFALLFLLALFRKDNVHGLWVKGSAWNWSVLFSNIRVRTDTDTGTLYQVLFFTLALLSSLNYILID